MILCVLGGEKEGAGKEADLAEPKSHFVYHATVNEYADTLLNW